MSTNRITAFLLAILFFTSFILNTHADEKLDDTKSIYDKGLLEIANDYEHDLSRIRKAYSRHLKSKLEDMKNTGNLRGYETIAAEQKRFEAEKTIPEGSVVDAHLQKAQVIKDKKIIKLSKRYIEALNKQKIALMKEESIDDATDVQEEIERISFIVADLETSMPKEETRIRQELTHSRDSGSKSIPSSIKRGLVLYYDFDRDEKDVVSDKSGKGNDGKVDGATWKTVSGGRRGVIDVDGDDDKLSVAPITVENGWSLAGWSTFPVRPRHGWSVLLASEPAQGHVVAKSDGQLGVFFNRFSGSDFNLNDLKGWHHISAVASSGSTVFYVDGERVGTANNACTAPIKAIGNQSVPRVKLGWGGQLDDVMIWNRTLTEDEIQQVYKMTGSK